MRGITCILCVALFVGATNGAKILTLLPMAGPSQFHLIMSLMHELGNKGHEITLITTTPGKTTHPNVTVFSQQVSSFGEEIVKDMMDKGLADDDPDSLWILKDFVEILPAMIETFLSKKEIKDIMDKGMQYDLAIVDYVTSEWTAAITTIVAKNTIYLVTCGPMPWNNPAPIPPSYVPTVLEPMPVKMNFRQRFRNAMLQGVNVFVYHYYLTPMFQELVDKKYPLATKQSELHKKVHFMIANEDPVMYSPRPSVPNLIKAGCWHCRDAKPLPKDLEDFIQKSGEHGFIMFGLGSNVKSEFLGPEILQSFLKAFARLKQNVIWKFGSKLDNVPKNVKLINWMPQQDLLAHPKIKLFMSHGGLLSMQEAIYHGVPVIGFPVFADQPGNVARIKELHLGEYMHLLKVTEQSIYSTINKILDDKSYAENSKKMSAILRDQPEHPLQRATFWIEYVIRHDGAYHLRNAGTDLNFFQYFLLDVIGAVAAASAIALYILCKVVKFSLRKLGFCPCKSKASSKKTN